MNGFYFVFLIFGMMLLISFLRMHEHFFRQKIIGKWLYRTRRKRNVNESLLEWLETVYHEKQLSQFEYDYVKNRLTTTQIKAKEIMIPRIQMDVLSIHQTQEQQIEVLKETKHTYYPIMEDDKDGIIGMILTHEWFVHYLENSTRSIQTYMKPVLHIHEHECIETVFQKMNENNVEIAIVLDEYGGTEGMITKKKLLRLLTEGKKEPAFSPFIKKPKKETFPLYHILNVKKTPS